MPLILEANYSKKLGLPGYSSHQYSVTVRTELSDLNHVEAESQRLYALLQTCVDREIQQTGFLPGLCATNGNGNGKHCSAPNGHQPSGVWKCTPKQRDLILKLVEDRKLSSAELDRLSQQLFGLGIRDLDKLQASGIIGELTAEEPQSSPRRQPQGRQYAAGGRR